MSIELTHFLQDRFRQSAPGIPGADWRTYKEKLQKERYTSFTHHGFVEYCVLPNRAAFYITLRTEVSQFLYKYLLG